MSLHISQNTPHNKHYTRYLSVTKRATQQALLNVGLQNRPKEKTGDGTESQYQA